MVVPSHSEEITVMGGGSWGATMAQYLSTLGHSVTVWHRNVEELRVMAEERTHPFIPDLKFSPSVGFTSDLSSLRPSRMVFIAVPSHGVRELVRRLTIIHENTVVINLAKGIENETLLRMSQVITEVAPVSESNVATLSGPSHAEEVARKVPTAVVVAGTDTRTIESIQKAISSEVFRVYANTDSVGVELAGSVKNVSAMAAGVCDGIGLGDNTKAALITRGIVEITRLGVAMGAKAETIAGLSGMGDLLVTCLSQYSRNRYVGEQIGRGGKLSKVLKEMRMVAEGVRTTESVSALSEKYRVDMPICTAVHGVLFGGEDPREAVKRLMTRELVYEG
ncbi:MAG: NAD(P)H-dependent glycerol-3-phosphate dehydrogenase [Fidelibacterota bacterium]